MIETIYLAPNFLEDFASDNLLDAVSGGVIRMELLCQEALEGSISEIADTLPATIVADIFRSFHQLRLCRQGTTLPSLSLLVDRAQQRA